MSHIEGCNLFSHFEVWIHLKVILGSTYIILCIRGGCVGCYDVNRWNGG